jgi:transposase-like protein
MVIQLYSKGITTREISDLIEKMYGQYYSAQTVSTITKNVEELVTAFHTRTIQDRYVAIYCDATYLDVRRDTVEKEALHILQGITEDGTKEILDYALFPTERAENYMEMLQNLKERGLKEVLLFVTDGLSQVRERILECFPKARHQYCWTHLARNIMKYVRSKDKRRVMEDFKKIHQQKNAEEALTVLVAFCRKYEKVYPKIVERLSDLTGLFEFYSFPDSIRSSLYTTNMIENWNKEIKRQAKKKVQFSNESALDRFLCVLTLDYNRKFSTRTHKGFEMAKAEIEALFEAEVNKIIYAV